MFTVKFGLLHETMSSILIKLINGQNVSHAKHGFRPKNPFILIQRGIFLTHASSSEGKPKYFSALSGFSALTPEAAFSLTVLSENAFDVYYKNE